MSLQFSMESICSLGNVLFIDPDRSHFLLLKRVKVLDENAVHADNAADATYLLGDSDWDYIWIAFDLKSALYAQQGLGSIDITGVHLAFRLCNLKRGAPKVIVHADQPVHAFEMVSLLRDRGYPCIWRPYHFLEEKFGYAKSAQVASRLDPIPDQGFNEDISDPAFRPDLLSAEDISDPAFRPDMLTREDLSDPALRLKPRTAPDLRLPPPREDASLSIPGLTRPEKPSFKFTGTEPAPRKAEPRQAQVQPENNDDWFRDLFVEP